MEKNTASSVETQQESLCAQAKRRGPWADAELEPIGVAREHPVLSRPYRVLAFDWDGTAVASREHATDELRDRTEGLARQDIWLAIITGTKFENLVRQYFHLLSPEARHLHIACVNRGSEVFCFSVDGHHEVLHRRTATPRENHAMDRVARAAQAELRDRFGLDTRIVFRRFNRRKLDLIPIPEWADPPKAKIGELLEAVCQRLTAAGIGGGIRQIMDRVGELAKREGIDLRLTSDVKHVELGLTDKSDSMTYLLDAFAPSQGIATEEILMVGDEFGPIDGLEGSDFRTFQPGGPAYVSVGREPNGVPEGVLHVGGGVPMFLAILDHQIALSREGA